MIAEGGHETSLRKTGYGGDQIPCKKKKSPPEMNQPAGNVTIKERALSTLDIAILFQVVQEIPGRVGPHSQPVQVMVTVGKIHHVLPVAAFAVKPAALTQEAYKFGRVGGGNSADIRQNIHMLVHADNFCPVTHFCEAGRSRMLAELDCLFIFHLTKVMLLQEMS